MVVITEILVNCILLGWNKCLWEHFQLIRPHSQWKASMRQIPFSCQQYMCKVAHIPVCGELLLDMV